MELVSSTGFILGYWDNLKQEELFQEHLIKGYLALLVCKYFSHFTNGCKKQVTKYWLNIIRGGTCMPGFLLPEQCLQVGRVHNNISGGGGGKTAFVPNLRGCL